MIKYDKDKPLFSLHVAKAAGSSFRKTLTEWFGDDFYPHYIDEELGILRDEERLREKFTPKNDLRNLCVHGHFTDDRGVGVFNLYKQASQFIVFLRNPLNLFLSRYYFNKQRVHSGGFYTKGQIVKKNKYSDVDDSLMNGSVEVLRYLPFKMNFHNYKDTIDKHFIYIGIVEDMERSVKNIANRLNKKYIKPKFINVGSHDETASQSAIREFKANHKLEYAVYSYARSVHEKQI